MARSSNKTLSARDKKMYNMRRDGHSLEEIAQLFNVSRATAGRSVTRQTKLRAAEILKDVKDDNRG